jgi:undecaprenyl-diphosphatase
MQLIEHFDSTVYSFVAKYITKNLTVFMKIISYSASWQGLIIISVIVFLTLMKFKKAYTVYGKIIFINLAASSILNETLKAIFRRERPDILRLTEAVGFSFPSGHSMVGLSFYGLLMYFSYKNSKNIYSKLLTIILFSTLIILIGISRVYLGVHYGSDVLAGFLVGAAWLSIFIWKLSI